MSNTVEAEFISHFHSLTGTTIKEKTKNLFILLNKTQHSLQLASGKINLTSLKPATPLEESFKVTALIHFKCANELLDVLKSENPILIAKVLKHSSWIIKQAFIDITPEYLAEQLFPNISYIAKLKLLNHLAYHMHDTHIADRYFETIKEHYGFYLASKLLSACSGDLIIKSIECYKVEITPMQLLLILKRYPNLTEIVFEKLDQQNAKIATGEKYESVFKYLSKRDHDLFIKLYEKYSPTIRLGSKETDTFIKNVYTLNAPKSITKLYKVLKTKQIGKSMGNDFQEFYFKIFPKRVNDLKMNFEDNLKLLDYLPNGPQKLKMFSAVFQEIYGNEIWNYPDLVHQKLIEWMSPDRRVTWMESRSRPSNVFEETWISYYKTEKSIPLLKEKIMLTSNIRNRSKLVLALLETCKLNKDEFALLEILQYINLKHRNDHNTVIQPFLSTFNCYYKANQLTEEHWNEINQCVQLYILNKGDWCSMEELLEKCICFRLSHNLPINNILEFWTKQNVYEFNICKSKPKFQKHCLKEFEKIIPLVYKNEELKKIILRYLYCVNIYNNSHPRDKLCIDIGDEYIEYIKSTNDYYAFGAACVLIFQDFNRAEEKGLLELLFKADYYSMQHEVMVWLIKEHTLLIMKYFKYILIANSYGHFIPKFVRKFCTKYTHVGIPQNICKLCYDVLDNKQENDTHKIKAAIIIMSLVLTPQEFLQFASAYYPVELTPDLGSDVNQTLYIKQQTIAAHFRNLIPISQALNGILQFCKGDYLKFSQKSLDIASVNVVENKLPSFFSALKERAVSVRKHAIFLPSRVLGNTQSYCILLEFKQKEKNSTLYKVLFKTVFHKFLNEPNDFLWDLTKQIMTTIDVSDGEAFEILTTCRHIALEYFQEYLEFAWVIIQRCTSSKETVENGQLKLLNMASIARISMLPTAFCTTVIEQNLFKCKKFTDFQKGVQSFASSYLIYGPGTEEKRLENIFIQFENLEIKDLNNIKMPLKLKLIYSFVVQFCDDIMNEKCTNKVIFGKFLNKWKNMFQPSEVFDEFVYLQLTSVYLNAIDNKLNISQVGECIVSICNQLHQENCLIAKNLSDSLSTFLYRIYALEFIGESDENEMTLIEYIVSNSKCFECLELAIYLLPINIPLTPLVKRKYDFITDVISKEANNRVQVAFNTYLKTTVALTE